MRASSLLPLEVRFQKMTWADSMHILSGSFTSQVTVCRGPRGTPDDEMTVIAAPAMGNEPRNGRHRSDEAPSAANTIVTFRSVTAKSVTVSLIVLPDR